MRFTKQVSNARSLFNEQHQQFLERNHGVTSELWCLCTARLIQDNLTTSFKSTHAHTHTHSLILMQHVRTLMECIPHVFLCRCWQMMKLCYHQHWRCITGSAELCLCFHSEVSPNTQMIFVREHCPLMLCLGYYNRGVPSFTQLSSEEIWGIDMNENDAFWNVH